MAHKNKYVSTGGGYSVLNNGVETQVISQSGTILANIQDTLAQGSVYIGDASNVTSELSIKTNTGFLVGNGTTAAVQTMSGDATMTNAGAVTVGKINGATLGTTTATDKNILVANGTQWASVAMSGDVTISNTGATTIGAGKVHTSMLSLLDDTEVTIGTTTATAATKISLEFDETTTGIGLINIGSTSVPQVLNANPGAAVISDTINILHSAGAGDCNDLYGRYTKVAVSGDGDSGLTLVGDAPRAYVLGGTTVASEIYGSQPWAKHTGTGTIQAMSAVSAALILEDADAFTSTNSINSGHFHIKTSAGDANGTVTSSNFDGVMIEVYPNVTGLQSMLHLANESSAGVTSAINIDGGANITNVLEIDSTTGCVVESYTGNDAFVPNNKGTFTQVGQLKIKIGDNTYYIPYGTVA